MSSMDVFWTWKCKNVWIPPKTLRMRTITIAVTPGLQCFRTKYLSFDQTFQALQVVTHVFISVWVGLRSTLKGTGEVKQDDSHCSCKNQIVGRNFQSLIVQSNFIQDGTRWLSIYFPWLWKGRNSSNKILVLILISEPKISNLGAPASMCHIFIWRFIFERWLPSDSTWRGTLPHWKLSMNLLWHSVSKTSWLFMTFHDFPWFFMIFQDFSKIFSATPLGKRLFHIRSVWIFYEGPRAIFPTCSQTCKWKWSWEKGLIDYWKLSNKII